SLSVYPESVENLTGEDSPEQQTFQIIYRHGIEETDNFVMEPDFKNFQEIKKGDLLAIQNGNEIRSEWNANIFMPLYQKQGNDGFFIIEKV
ncbi:MAG TPA: succinylglutamate desuccinylase, partial [Salinimicrobium sp.]|nr:succinylglutamate desuccinylase [Salinimicrobium sp.]